MDLLQPQLLIWLLLALAIMLVFLFDAKTAAVDANPDTSAVQAEASTQLKAQPKDQRRMGALWQRFCAQQLSRQASWVLLVAANGLVAGCDICHGVFIKRGSTALAKGCPP